MDVFPHRCYSTKTLNKMDPLSLLPAFPVPVPIGVCSSPIPSAFVTPCWALPRALGSGALPDGGMLEGCLILGFRAPEGAGSPLAPIAVWGSRWRCSLWPISCRSRTYKARCKMASWLSWSCQANKYGKLGLWLRGFYWAAVKHTESVSEYVLLALWPNS